MLVYEFRRPGLREKLIRFLAAGRPVILNVELYGGCVKFPPNVVPYIENLHYHGHGLSPTDFEHRGFVGQNSGVVGDMKCAND